MGSEVDQAGLIGDMVSPSGAVGAYTSPFSLRGGGCSDEGRARGREASSPKSGFWSQFRLLRAQGNQPPAL